MGRSKSSVGWEAKAGKMPPRSGLSYVFRLQEPDAVAVRDLALRISMAR